MDISVGQNTQINTGSGKTDQWINIHSVVGRNGLAFDANGYMYQVLVLTKGVDVRLVTLPEGDAWFSDFMNETEGDGWTLIHHQKALGVKDTPGKDLGPPIPVYTVQTPFRWTQDPSRLAVQYRTNTVKSGYRISKHFCLIRNGDLWTFTNTHGLFGPDFELPKTAVGMALALEETDTDWSTHTAPRTTYPKDVQIVIDLYRPLRAKDCNQ